MKKILGLDLGVSSVGMSVIYENGSDKKIAELAVRIIPEDPNFHGKFYSGNTASKNLERTKNRGIRRGNQRFKQRRDNLYRTLKENNIFPNESLFKLDALSLYELRYKAVTQKITLEEIGRVLIHLNQRRGFSSNRKSNNEEEKSSDYKKRITELQYELGEMTIGQKLYLELKESNNPISILIRERTYLRSSYIEEFDRIFECQKTFYPLILTGGINEDDNKGTLYDTLKNKILFFQRPLKSQKGLVSECNFEKHHKSINKSSPFFETFRIWQRINDLSWKTTKGETRYPTLEQKKLLFNKLFKGEDLNVKGELTVTKIKEVLGYSKNDKIYLNFTELDGSKTYRLIKNALVKANLNKIENYLFFNYHINDEKGGLFELWHILYSLPTEVEIINTLKKRFKITLEQATIIAKEVGFNADFGSLSTRAIKKLLPYLENGLGYNQACDKVGYDHSGYKTKIELKGKLENIKQNSLRNPVVEQVLNQVVNIVNLAIEKHGMFDEIRVELARELRNSAKTRKKITKSNADNKRANDNTRERLKTEYDFKIVNGRDIQRYNLWNETNQICLYCNSPISKTDFLTGQADIEHILPKSRSFSNNMNNFILAHKKCNSTKGQMTAYDFMSKSSEKLNEYIEKVNTIYNDGKGKISRAKFENLMCSGEDIPSDFVERMKKDSQYISKEAVKMLKTVCENTYTTTGQITDFLREKWGLKEVLKEINFEKYESIGQVEVKEIKDSIGKTKSIKIIKNWTKRDDHRHHAIDALICALTNQKIIFKLNNLNKIYQLEKETLTKEERLQIEKILSENAPEDVKFDLKTFAEHSDNYFDPPFHNFKEETKKHLDNIFISIKKTTKVLSPTFNKAKKIDIQKTWTPRGRLHEETIMGQVKRITDKKTKLNEKFYFLDNIVDKGVKGVIENYLKQYNGKPEIAFSSKNLKQNPLIYKGKEIKDVSIYETTCTKRVKISENITEAQIEKITDNKIKKLLKKRISDHSGKLKQAFANINDNPIWLNKEKGIQIKTITVFDESKVEKVRDGFVKTGGNHHAIIYKTEDGKYNDKVVSFWEAVEIGLLNIQSKGNPYPIIDKSDDSFLGKFQFSMQINDLFVFDLKHSLNPQNDNEINLLDSNNRSLISKKLFRIQKMSKKSSGEFDVHFRHHLETTILRDIPELTWINLRSNKLLHRLTKIRINSLGEIIKIGE
jgi:CRISPR-associated endonuclease Csn1